MATVDLRTRQYPGNFNAGARDLSGRVQHISRYIDTTAAVGTGPGATGTLTSGDVMQLFTIKSGTRVIGLMVEVVAAQSGATSCDFGDSASGTTFEDTCTLEATGDFGRWFILSADWGAAVSKLYAADDYLSFTPNANCSTLKMVVTMFFIDESSQAIRS